MTVLTNPKSVLDVGAGFGKYGVLSREYLDVWGRGAEVYGDWERLIDGIEAWQDYLTPLHDFVYDNMYVGDALDILPTLQTNYDLILLIDVLEHLSFKDGMKLVKECQARGTNILISTPRDIGPIVATYNPFETHRFQWKKKHFAGLDNKLFIRNPHSLILYVGRDAQRLRRDLFLARFRRGFLTHLLSLGGIAMSHTPLLRTVIGIVKRHLGER
ncbi:MAG: hypothetical protein ACE5IJ_07805 [Thermoplasmata archaeon]